MSFLFYSLHLINIYHSIFFNSEAHCISQDIRASFPLVCILREPVFYVLYCVSHSEFCGVIFQIST